MSSKGTQSKMSRDFRESVGYIKSITQTLRSHPCGQSVMERRSVKSERNLAKSSSHTISATGMSSVASSSSSNPMRLPTAHSAGMMSKSSKATLDIPYENWSKRRGQRTLWNWRTTEMHCR